MSKHTFYKANRHDPVANYINSLNKLSNPYRLMVLRTSDGIPLATGWSRAGCESVANTFRKLGIPCHVQAASNHRLGETLQSARARFNEWRRNRPS